MDHGGDRMPWVVSVLDAYSSSIATTPDPVATMNWLSMIRLAMLHLAMTHRQILHVS